MAVSSGHETARLALRNAEVACRKGDQDAALAWLRAAIDEAAAWLTRVDAGFRVWPQWRRFFAACELRPDVHDHRLGWHDALHRSLAEAHRSFQELEISAAHRPAPEHLEASLAVALEDLLDQVWACEREWDFDDRVLGPPGLAWAGGGSSPGRSDRGSDGARASSY